MGTKENFKQKNKSEKKNEGRKTNTDHEKQNVLSINKIKAVIQEIKEIELADKINIVMAIFTFISVIGVFVTLSEMKVQRNMSYSPSIVMNPIEVSFAWDEYGNPSWLDDGQGVESTIEENEDGSISGSLQVPIIGITESFMEYSVVNIGVGTAKNIVFKWDEDNTQNLCDYLISCDASKEDFCVIGEASDVFSINEHLVMTNKENMMELMYMLPEATESYSLYFPVQYTILIEEMIKNGYNDCPPLILYITYYDLQGDLKNDVLVIRIKRTFFYESEDGSGKALYQLVPAFPSESYK